MFPFKKNGSSETAVAVITRRDEADQSGVKHMLKRAVSGSGSRSVLRALLTASKTFDQKSARRNSYKTYEGDHQKTAHNDHRHHSYLERIWPIGN